MDINSLQDFCVQNAVIVVVYVVVVVVVVTAVLQPS